MNPQSVVNKKEAGPKRTTCLVSAVKFFTPLFLSICTYLYSSHALAETKSSSTKPLRWEMVEREGFTSFKIPKLLICKNQEALKKVNQTIQDATADLRCHLELDADEPQSRPEDVRIDYFNNREFEVKMNVTFATDDIFSIRATSSYYCGGAYPTNDATFSMTFDLKTGEKIEFADLFADYDRQKPAILNLIFSKEIRKAEKFGKALDDGNCDRSGVFLRSFLIDGMYAEFDYSFSNKGLEVQPRWPHGVEACAKRVVVPYKKLSKYSRQGGILDMASRRMLVN